MQAVTEMLWIICLDVLFIGLLILLMVPFGIYRHTAFAVLKRNFVGYFRNPTGYVFLCLFVLLTSFFAFCLPEFFTSNLANFDQLNRYLPLIMLVFIPAITMSIWAEEKRQGTDELLLTLPAADYDIVIGKYLAAVCVFTVSLIFSQLCNYMVLIVLTGGDLDTGLLFTTYFGYWLIGLAMLAIGMVASFFTKNLTVGFVTSVLLNTPLVIASYMYEAASFQRAQDIAHYGLLGQFEEFGHGVIGAASMVYFIMIAVVMLYVCFLLVWNQRQGATYTPLIVFWMVFGFVGVTIMLFAGAPRMEMRYIGLAILAAVVGALPLIVFGVIVAVRGIRKDEAQVLHYLVRATCVFLIGCGVLTLTASKIDRIVRIDMTRGNVASLHPDSVTLVKNLDRDRPPVVIDAFVGDQIPPDYVKTRNELVTRLRDFEAKSRGQVKVNINEGVTPFGTLAKQAEQRFGIVPQMVVTRHRGAVRQERVILGAAFSCGLDRVVVPFFDYGIPVEYELIRSINTVSEGARKKIGVVRTDASMMGGFSMHTFSSIPKQPIIDELEKQYDVEEVSPDDEILGEKFDAENAKYAALLVVQPSSLTPPQLENLLEAIRNGQPTAIFEDPEPAMLNCPGTSEPKPPRGGSPFGGGQPPEQKCEIQRLWDLLNIDVLGGTELGQFLPYIIWQPYKPYRKINVQDFGPEWVFVREEAPGASDAFNPESKVASGLSEVLFPFPSALEEDDTENEDLDFTPLVTTGYAGRIRFDSLQESRGNPEMLDVKRGTSGTLYTLAARIKSTDLDESADHNDTKEKNDKKSDEGDDDSENEDNAEDTSDEEDAEKPPINVIYVGDIDLLSGGFVRVRAQPDQEMNWKFENVTFVLNIIDTLAKDDEYIDIRKRKPMYTTLRYIEQKIKYAQDAEEKEKEQFQKNFEEEKDKLEKQIEKTNKELQAKYASMQEKKNIDFGELQAFEEKMQETARKGVVQLAREVKRLERVRDEEIEKIRDKNEEDIENTQTRIRILSVLLPPIPPLIIGLLVFVIGRLREREGVSKDRLL